MDNGKREDQSQGSGKSVINSSNIVFFINNELVKIVHRNKPNNICYLHNYIHDKEQTMLYSDFKKHRKKAYTVATTLKIFKRSRMQFSRLIKSNIIPAPTGASKGGERKWQTMSYYSEDDIYKIREAMGNIHIGKPRKDGRVTPAKDILSEKDLRSLLGDGMMLYTKTEDGRFIPVWQEETW
jgi:hypothetical protein